MWCVTSRDAEVITVTPGTDEKLVVAGAPLAANASTTSDGAVGDYACFISVTDTDTSGTDGWWMLGNGLTAWQ